MSQQNPLNSWKTLSSELVYESAWIAVNKHQTINPAGNPAIYSVVNFKNKAIGILPLSDDGYTWLVGQWRYPLNTYCWEIPEGGGTIFFNPEYGERLGEETELEDIYKEIGDFMKKSCKGYKGYIFTGNLELAKKIGLKTTRRIEFYNGKIDCRLMEYELYDGTKRVPKSEVISG